MNNSFTKEEIETLQNISMEITSMALHLENIKNIMKNYLFVDCGEKLNPNIVLNECYEQSLNISYDELEEITYKLNTICFRGNTDYNSVIFENSIVNKKRKIQKDENNDVSYSCNFDEYHREYDNNYHDEYNNDNDCGYDKTLYRMGHLSMNPIEEPFLGPEA